MRPEEILQRPVVTEKTARMGAENQYVFVVRRDATKPEIARAVAETFKVKVREVRTVNVKGKRKRRRLHWVRRPATKRAIVTLAAGQQIDMASPA